MAEQAHQLRHGRDHGAIAKSQRGRLTDGEIRVVQAPDEKLIGLRVMLVRQATHSPPAVVSFRRSRQADKCGQGSRATGGQRDTCALRAQVVPGGEVVDQA